MAKRDKDPGTEKDVLVKERPKVKKPPMYRVLLHNDDYTPMDFVVQILQGIFSKSESEAVSIMLNVHNKGIGLAGVYTHEVAETQVAKVQDLAEQHQHPLQCTMEPEK